MAELRTIVCRLRAPSHTRTSSAPRLFYTSSRMNMSLARRALLDWRVGAVVLSALAAAIYWPAMNRVFAADQLWYFAEVGGHDSLALGLRHVDYAHLARVLEGRRSPVPPDPVHLAGRSRTACSPTITSGGMSRTSPSTSASRSRCCGCFSRSSPRCWRCPPPCCSSCSSRPWSSCSGTISADTCWRACFWRSACDRSSG